MRERELRSPAEALRSLTKFMTIIIIALSLEAVVGIFEAGREKQFEQLVYPTLVMAAAVSALVGARRLSVPEPPLAARGRGGRGRRRPTDRSPRQHGPG